MTGGDLISILSRADELYRERARIEEVRESVRLLSSVGGGTERFEVQWRVARSLFFLGQEAESKGAKKQLHAAGIDAGRRAAELLPERVEGHFWLGVNLALFAEVAGGIRAAKSLVRAMRALKKAARISAEYHDAGPLRVLGRIYHKAPWVIGGSLSRSRACFTSALEMAPSNSVTLVYAAELAIDLKERERAVSLLESVINLPSDPEWEFENRRDKEKSRSLLDELCR